MLVVNFSEATLKNIGKWITRTHKNWLKRGETSSMDMALQST